MSGRQPPANLARELLEEIDIIGALGRPADQFIDLMGVWPDQNAPLVGLDCLGRGAVGCGSGWAKVPMGGLLKRCN
jgi:hypothetical protein